MLDDQWISLTVLDNFKYFFCLSDLVIFSENIANAKRSSSVHFVEFEHAEILLHCLAKLLLLCIDVASVESAGLVVNVCNANSSVGVTLVAHL